MQWQIDYFDDNGNRDVDGLNFVAVSPVEVGTASTVIARLFMRLNVHEGFATYKVFCGTNGTVPPTWVSNDLDSRKSNDYLEFVDTKTRQVSVIGKRSTAKAIVAPAWVPLAK